MWELDYKESWVLKNWCFWTVVLEKTLESPLDCKEIQPVHPKGDQSWIFIGRTHAETETPILWPPDTKNWLIWKDPDAGKDWRWEKKGMTEDEMVGWYHHLNGHGFGWTPWVGDAQGGLMCCSSQGCKQLDTTERLNWTELNVAVNHWPRNAGLIIPNFQWLRTQKFVSHACYCCSCSMLFCLQDPGQWAALLGKWLSLQQMEKKISNIWLLLKLWLKSATVIFITF